jgi:predicted MFS family arabinose efflux permease
VGIPVAAVAFAVLQKTLHLPVVRREHHIDFLGATLLMGGVSILLVWVSLAGNQFAWTSPVSDALVVIGLAVIAAAVYVEGRVAAEPIIPLRLFRDRTTALATAASVLVGVAMFGATVYLSQYFQIARGMTPTHAGLMTVFMVGGLVVSSMVTGRIISRTGTWKRYLVSGMILVVVGLALLSRIDETTPLAAWAWAPPCRTSCSRCRTTPRRPTWGPRAHWSRSSAASVARSVWRRSGRCSATRCPRRSPRV